MDFMAGKIKLIIGSHAALMGIVALSRSLKAYTENGKKEVKNGNPP